LADTATFLLMAPEPGPSEAVTFEESLRLVNERLDPQEREVLLMRMEGREYYEIAELLNVSERSIRRKMVVVKGRMGEVFMPDADSAL